MTENSQSGSNPLKRFFGPMVRTILVGLSGMLVFMISIFAMMPLRMAASPVENYNLFYTPIIALILLGRKGLPPSPWINPLMTRIPLL